MANLGFSIRSAFGFIPKTEKIEAQDNSLKQEFEKLSNFTESDDFKEYTALKELTSSDEFKQNKQEILALDYKKTEEFQKESNFIKLKKNKGIINYFKVESSQQLADFISTSESEELKQYIELKEYLESTEHANIVNDFNSKLKAEKEKAIQLKSLSKSKSIKDYFKILKSQAYINYNNIKDSDELIEFNELKEFCTSQNLVEFKKAIAEQLQVENDKQKEIKELKNNAIVKEYLKNHSNDSGDKPTEVGKLEELENYVNSAEYKNKLNELEYKNTDEYKKEQKYIKLLKDKRLKSYDKFLNSDQYNHYKSFKDSDELKEYEELKEYVASPAYKEALNNYEYKNTDEFKKEVQFTSLKKAPKITSWEKYQKSKAYIFYKEIENSDLLNEFKELEEFVNSDKFKEFKEYMLDKDKWKKTDDFIKENRLAELEKSADIKWYFATKDSKKFDELKAWKITFEDDFTTGKVEDEKWMNNYFWGKMMLNDRYVMADDKQYYTDNKNFEINGTTLKIITKQEKTEGKAWHAVHGFFTKEFNYTSGMLSTAHSFRQQYGRIEAKIKLNGDYPIYQAFWLKGEKILPGIDIFRFNMGKKNRLQMSTFWGDPLKAKEAKRKTDKLNGVNFTKDYFIYTLDWEENKLTWRINGIEVFSTTEGIPSEPLYLMLSAGIQQDLQTDISPSAFEIDWVRCFEKAKN